MKVLVKYFSSSEYSKELSLEDLIAPGNVYLARLPTIKTWERNYNERTTEYETPPNFLLFDY